MREMREKDGIAGAMKQNSKGEKVMAQVIEKFRVADADIKEQIENYIDDNSGYTVVTFASIGEAGDETVLVVFDDGE